MAENDKKLNVIKKNTININEIDKNNMHFKERFGIEVKNNNKLPKILIDFLSYLETIKGKSYNTIEAYKIDLSLLFKYLKVYKDYPIPDDIEFEEIPINDLQENFVKDITLSDLYAFLSFTEKQRNNGTYARARKVATIKSYFNYLQGKAKIINSNPAAELESPKINKRHPIYLTLEESVSLLSSLDKNNYNYLRDYCILTLFLNCGMRLSELVGINIRDIDFDENKMTVIGKGNKERVIYLNKSCINAINDYLASRPAPSLIKRDSKNSDKALFLSEQKKRISNRTVQLIITKELEAAGLDTKKLSVHKLRHTAATLMYQYGNVDIRALQELLGHESIATTEIYTHVSNEQVRDAIERNPLNQ